jgi:UDP-N-acetylbacillosamine N-acetyltransferase
VSLSKRVFLFGYSGHAYVIIESFYELGYTIMGYFADQEATSNPYKIPYFGSEENVDAKTIIKDDLVFPAVGDNQIRAKLISFFDKHQLNQLHLIDPTARVSVTVNIGVSTYIGKNVSVNAQARIGRGVIINTAAIVEHECVVEDFTHIAPGAVLCGNVYIGERTFVGANTVVRNNLSIDSSIIIGAGSVIVKSINSKGVFAGNPIRKIK